MLCSIVIIKEIYMTTMLARKDLLRDLHDCKIDKFECRLDVMLSRGVDGLRDIISLDLRNPVHGSPVKSKFVKRLVDLFVKGLAREMTQPKLFGAFRILYWPHFKIIRLSEDMYDKYWDTFEFLDWMKEVNNSLSQTLIFYHILLQEFPQQIAAEYMISDVSPVQHQQRLKQYKELIYIFSFISKSLLTDISSLFDLYIKSLETCKDIKQATTKIDQIALHKRVEDLQIYIQKQKKLLEQIESMLSTIFDKKNYLRADILNLTAKLSETRAKVLKINQLLVETKTNLEKVVQEIRK